MSDRIRFGSNGSQYLQQQQQQQQQNRCSLCLDDDRNGNFTGMCQHTTNVESALHYLRNLGTSVNQASSSPSYGSGVSSPYYWPSQDTTAAAAAALTSLQGAFGGVGNSPPVSPNYYSVAADILLRMNRMKQEQLNSGGFNQHHQMRAPPASRPPKPKSEMMGCLRECAFCKSNGETAEFYKSHFLKDPVGRVRCPILQRYQCPFCYATGENAHTRRYCPKNPNKMSFIKSDQLVKQNLL